MCRKLIYTLLMLMILPLAYGGNNKDDAAINKIIMSIICDSQGGFTASQKLDLANGILKIIKSKNGITDYEIHHFLIDEAKIMVHYEKNADGESAKVNKIEAVSRDKGVYLIHDEA